MPSLVLTHGWWDRHWLKVCLIALFIWTTVGFVATTNERSTRIDANTEFAVNLRNGLVRSCNDNGNPLREAVQELLEEQIKQSKPSVVAKLFPQIAPEELERLIREQNENKRKIIKKIAPLKCESLYPTTDSE
jgi:hypothetical protein